MPSIRDFSGGVLNQELQNRDAGAGIIFDCKNVISSWNGELRKRTGTRLLKELDGNSKIIPYRLPDGNDMIMVLKDKVIKCYKFDNEGNLVPYTVISSETGVPFPTTGWNSDTNGDWTVSGSSTYTSGMNGAYLAVSGRSYLFNADSDFSEPGSVFFRFDNENPVVFGECSFVWGVDILGRQNYYCYRCGIDPIIQYSDDGENWAPIQTDSSSVEQSAWTTSSGGPAPIPTSHTKYSYSVYNNSYFDAHKYWRVVFLNNYVSGTITMSPKTSKLQVNNIKFITGVTEEDLVFNNCPYTNDDFDNIRWAQNNRTLTMTCRNKQPYQIGISSGVFYDSLFTPTDYANIWTTQGYPTSVTYYQNRLWFGGFDSAPNRVYASAFGEFDKFTIPDPILATSPIMADGTEITNVIENMWGGNNALYCLSADGISMIDAQGAIVATDQVEFKLRNREPVDAMVPTVKDDIMIYLGRDKRKILITDYDFVVQRFKANCISDNYNNFLKSGIKELHYIPRKSSLIYGVLQDGKWFAELFSVDKSKNALYPFETNGRVVDIQPIKQGDETKLLMVTQLPSYQYVLEEKIEHPDQEIMDFMTKQEREDYTHSVMASADCYLDHSITKSYDEPTSVITDIPYLEGEKITVIADGIYLGEQDVVFNESEDRLEIVLDSEFSDFVLGYEYDSYAVLKFVSPYNMRKFPKEIAVNFINSGYAELGNTFESLKSVLNNVIEGVTLNNRPILMNGNYVMTLDKQTFETPYVIIRSKKGVPFIITGMDYKVDMSNYQGGV